MFALVTLNILSVTAIALIGWGLVQGPWQFVYWGLGLGFVVSVLFRAIEPDPTYTKIKWRRRKWGQPLSQREREQYGKLSVFEPACLQEDCHGPVVEIKLGKPPRTPRPFAHKYDSTLPSFYVQGGAYCARCREKYFYTIYMDRLSLRSMDERKKLSGSFGPLSTA